MKFGNILRLFLSTTGRYCICCNRPIYPDYIYSLCEKCRKEINWTNYNQRKTKDQFFFDDLFTCCLYESSAKNIITGFKGGKTFYAQPIANLMTDRFKTENLSVDLICFVPSDREKAVNIRGFVPTRLLSNIIGKKLNIPVLDVLERRSGSKENKKSNIKERQANVFNAFRVKDKKEKLISGKTLLLIDDVLTTGSTANEVSRILKKAGANKVYVLCFAGTPGQKN